MSIPQQDSSSRPLPQNVLYNILSRLPTSSLFTASLVSTEWRKLIFQSGPLSNALLRPHLSVLRDRFGFQQVPHRLPIPAVRKLLVRYAKQELSGTLCAKEIYSIKSYTTGCSAVNDKCTVPMKLRRFAACGSLLAISIRNKHIHIFELTKRPMVLLCKVSVKKQPIALAISEAYLAVLDEDGVSMYSLLARNTPSFMVVHVYSIKIPQIRHPTAIAITLGTDSTPLVSVLASSIYLLHPSYALTQKRGGFFRGHIEDQEDIIADPSRKGKEKEKETLSYPSSAAKQNPWLLVTSGSSIGASFPLAFSMRGRQVSVSTWGDYDHDFQRSGYIGALWSNEDPVQLKRRQESSLKDGEDILNATHSPDLLWRYYKARLNPRRTTTHKETGIEISDSSANRQTHRWHAHSFNTGCQMAVESAIHLYDSFYIVTEVKTRLIRIISVAPFTNKMALYRQHDNNSDHDNNPDPDSEKPASDDATAADRPLKHCGYAVIPGGKEGGYIAFNHRPGYIKTLPLRQIPMHVGTINAIPSEEQDLALGLSITRNLREIAIGKGGEIVGIAGNAKRLVVVMEERVVVVRLWTEEAPGRNVVEDVDTDWIVDRSGKLRANGQKPPLKGSINCAGCIVQ